MTPNQLYYVLLTPFLVASLGGGVYYLLAIMATRKLRKARAIALSDGGTAGEFPAISLLKPLRGADPNLERHLESFFLQDYPTFEILFAVRHVTDPAALIVRRLQKRYPNVSTRLIITGRPLYANAKVYSM